MVVACVVVVGCALVVVGGALVVVGGWLVVVVGGGSGDDGDGGGITVTVVVSFGPVMVTVCEVCGGAGSPGGVLPGLVLLWPRVSASNTATSTAAAAPPTVKTSAVRLYHGSRAVAAA